jgi:HEAT repeat protein
MFLPSRIAIVLSAALWMGATAGCRIFSGDLEAWRGPGVDDRWANSARLLRTDLWRSNTAWSPLHELSEVPISDPDVPLSRWIHPKLQEALRAAETDGLISPAVRRHAEATAVQPGGSADRGLNLWFAALAKENDLAGWNAAILWSHFDPIAAQAAAGVLSRLVLHPPKYQAEQKLSEDIARTGSAKPDLNKAATAKGATGRTPAPVEVSQNMRLAAAEAWCLVLCAAHEDAETALAPAGRALEDGKLPASVADELRRGIARRVRPDRIPGLVVALAGANTESPKVLESRRAAADACVIHAVQLRIRSAVTRADAADTRGASGDDAEALAAGVENNAPWPADFWQLRHDRDPRLRKRLGELVATIRHPAAFLVLKGQLSDVDTGVREAAILGLGVLGTNDALRELTDQAKRGEERLRELAVHGLACRGPAAVIQFTSEKSAAVRSEVARSVKRCPGAAASRVVRELLADSSLEVQRACLDSVRDWPESLATPLLLESLASSAFKTRQTALKQLEDRRGGGLAFPLYAGPEERALRVQQWSRDWNIPDAAVERVHELTRKGSPLLDQALLADLREKLSDSGPPGSPEAVVRISEWAQELSTADIPLVERFLAEAEPQQADLVLHHVLPRFSPAYAALVQLENSDAMVRRQGAMQISRLGNEASLSLAVCRRLHDLMKIEQDNLVWRLVMLGVYRDGSEEAARLALLAVNHHWPDVRILGCEYVGRHEMREQAAWLLPLFYDTNKAVQLSAVTAAGKCRNPIVLDGVPPTGGQGGLRGLRPLLVEAQGQLQFAAVASMSRLGDPQAMQELVRQALDCNSASRLDVVQTMGETGQTRFVEPLIRLAWTEPHHHVRQAALANLLKLVPRAEQPQSLSKARTVPEAVEIWAAWWEDRQMQRARL